PLVDDPLVAPADDRDLLRRPWNELDPLGLDTLVLPFLEEGLRRAARVEELPAEAVAGRAALAEAVEDVPAMALEHLDRELATVLAGHGALHMLDDRRRISAVVLELLGTE